MPNKAVPTHLALPLGIASLSPSYASYLILSRCFPCFPWPGTRSGLGQGNADLALVLAATVLVGRFTDFVGFQE